VIEPAQILGVDQIGRARDAIGINTAADHDDRSARIIFAVVRNLLGSALFALRPSMFLGQGRGGEGDRQGRDGGTIHKHFLFSGFGDRSLPFLQMTRKSKKAFPRFSVAVKFAVMQCKQAAICGMDFVELLALSCA